MKPVLALTRDYSSSGPPEQLAFDLESTLPPHADLRELWTPDDIFAAAVKDGADALLGFREDYRVEWKSARYSP